MKPVIMVLPLLIAGWSGKICLAQISPIKDPIQSQVKAARSPDESADDGELLARVDRLIADLSSPKFSVREDATRELWKIGIPAEKRLRVAAQSNDAEVAERAKAILADFDYGIYPTTDRKTRVTILGFRDGNIEQKKRSAKTLVGNGKISVLIKLILKEDDRSKLEPLIRDQFGNSRFARSLIENKNPLDAIEALHLLHENSDTLKFDPYRIEEIRSEILWLAAVTDNLARQVKVLANEADASNQYLRMRMLRAQGDFEGGRKIGQKIGSQEQADQVSRNLLVEEHSWSRLSDLHWSADQTAVSELEIPHCLLGLIFHRLAHEDQRFKTQLQALYQFSDPLLDDLALTEDSGLFDQVDNSTLDMIIEFLLANRQFEKAYEYLARTDRFQAFDAFVATDDYHRAFEAIGFKEISSETAVSLERVIRSYSPTRWDGSNDDIEKLTRVVQVLFELGFRTEAESLYRALFAVATRFEANQTGALSIVGNSLLREGLKDLFFELIESQLLQKNHEFALDCLFENQADHVDGVSLANFWWTVLESELPNQSPLERIRQLDRMLRPLAPDKKPDPQFLKWIAKIENDIDQGRGSWGDEAYIGYSHLLCNDREKAKSWLGQHDFSTASSSSVALKLGHLFFEDQQFNRAADAYLKAWRYGDQDVTGLYFAGIAQRAGKNRARSAQTIFLAKQLMFSPEDHRKVAAALIERKQDSDARPLLELAIQTCGFQSWEVGTARFQLINLLDENEGWKAANLLENQLLDVVLTPRYYPMVSSYTYYVQEVDLRESSQHILEGHPRKAAQALTRALEVRPLSASICENYLPKLRALPEGEELADRIFEKIHDRYLTKLESFPDSGLLNNNLAWINTTNRKHLPEALKHAERAVKNEPNNPTYIDTLADVCFNLGDVDRAISLMKKCLQINPLSEHYNSQMERFREQSPGRSPKSRLRP